MRITTKGVARMNSENSFLGKFKWEMGDVHTVVFPKIMLDPEHLNKHGEPMPIEGMLASEAAREVLYRRDITKELEANFTGAELEKEVNKAVESVSLETLHERYNKYTDLAAFAKMTRRISVETPESILARQNDPKKSGLYERVVASRGYRDDDGKYVRDTLDELASIVGVIQRGLETQMREKYKDSPDLSPSQVDDLVEGLKKKKPIKGSSVKIAMEVLAFKHSDSEVPKVEGTVATSNFLYMASTDHLAKITPWLYKGTDISLDYLELEVTHSYYKEKTEMLSKAKSGMNVGIKNVEAKALLTKNTKDFVGNYIKYRKANPMTEATIETKVPEFRTMEDNELLSVFRSWISKHSNVLEDSEREKYKETLEKINEVLDADEINKIIEDKPSNVSVENSQTDDIAAQTVDIYSELMGG